MRILDKLKSIFNARDPDEDEWEPRLSHPALTALDEQMNGPDAPDELVYFHIGHGANGIPVYTVHVEIASSERLKEIVANIEAADIEARK